MPKKNKSSIYDISGNIEILLTKKEKKQYIIIKINIFMML
jgi:hypothetical protein